MIHENWPHVAAVLTMVLDKLSMSTEATGTLTRKQLKTKGSTTVSVYYSFCSVLLYFMCTVYCLHVFKHVRVIQWPQRSERVSDHPGTGVMVGC